MVYTDAVAQENHWHDYTTSVQTRHFIGDIIRNMFTDNSNFVLCLERYGHTSSGDWDG